eukprot:NODE_4818_length_1842_cov_19.587755.p1 GENE.NODE_4818_length_1842_cov_19.587755~~NODE_4818_length_1842_cov_19.587755.p1  ORF type:complete len:386 (-),score=93.72 NODE_4818_length_1842_cov_19.587755:683-1675(-)
MPIYWLFHSWRLFGYVYMLPLGAYFAPRGTLATLAGYAVVHRQRWWQLAAQRVLRFGVSKRHRILADGSLDDRRQKHLVTIHPHGLLLDGWHSVLLQHPLCMDDEGDGLPVAGAVKGKLCFAPIIQHVPIHQETYQKRCSGSSEKDIVACWDEGMTPCIAPGGFAEAAFCYRDDDVEYAYLKDRKGFMRIAIKHKADLLPNYTFRLTRMYYSPALLRGVRARLSQRLYVGLVPFFGKMGTAMPLTDKTTTVYFKPFPASKYTLDQVDQAHAAFLEHLKVEFDRHKANYGMRNVELVFVGNDFVDEDWLARSLRRFGLLKPAAPPGQRSRL